MEIVPLYESNICRLCGEENDNGTSLYLREENDRSLSDIVNFYLPIQVSDDGRLPRTICPGCNIQLEATIDFINLIISGQKLIREYHQREKLYMKSIKSKQPDSENLLCELDKSNQIYKLGQPVALKVAGLDRPKRKRGRPPKILKSPEELEQEAATETANAEKGVTSKDNTENDETSRKRRRKTPQRFREAVQGKELERIFIEEGVIDGEESDNESKSEELMNKTSGASKELEVIGHLENSGELVMVTKGKGRGRPRGRMRATKEECAICGKEFTCVGRYMSHIAQHGKVVYECSECRERFTTRLEFKTHQDNSKHMGQKVIKYEEIESGVVVNSTNKDNELPDVKFIEATNQIQNVPDPLPDLNAVVEANLIPTQNVHKISPLIIVVTSETNEDTENSSLHIKSEKSTTQVFNASEPTESYPNEQSSKENVPGTEKKKLKCNHCDKVFSTKQSKSMHIKATHAGERPYVCKECGARFPYPRSLSLHALTHRRTNASRGFACDLCGKVLNHPSSVAYHKESEHAGQRYVCSKCNKSFKHKQLLQRHQMVHSQIRPFTCKTCHMSFKTKANLVNHQLLHSGVKKFGCELCKQRFAHKTSLTLHMRWHTGHKPYVCGVCGKSFTQKGNLSEHERIHTGEKPYRCTQCPRTFTTSSQHRLHMRRHAGETTYACPHCPRRFVSRETWRNHMRRETGARVHRCEECGRGFTERWALQKHRRWHSGERPFRCPHCPRAFSDCSNLNKHKKQAHKQISLLVSDKDAPNTIESVTDPLALADDGEPMPDLADGVIYVAYDVNDSNSFQILGPEQTASFDKSKILTTTCELYEGQSLMVGENQISLEDASAEIMEVDVDNQDKKLELDSRLYYETEDIDEQLIEGQGEQHMAMTDAVGNPLHFTMQDGTRLAITSIDGKCLQVMTEDGKIIPVEINDFNDAVGCGNNDPMVEPLNLPNDGGVEVEPVGEGLPAPGALRVFTLNDNAPIAHYFTLV